MIARRAVLALPLLAACEQMRPEPPARLPPGVVEGAGDPARFAVATALEALSHRPRADAARNAFAAAMAEHAATAFQDGAHADGWHVTRLLREGRTALRNALGIRPETLPQAAQDALLAAAAALRAGDADGARRAMAAVAAGDPLAALAARLAPAPLGRGLRAANDLLSRRGVGP